MFRPFILLMLLAMLPFAETMALCTADSVQTDSGMPKRQKPFKERLAAYFDKITYIDTSYIEPQHYNYTVMLQNTNTFDVYRITNKAGQEIVLSPEFNYKIGPYFGYRWLFLGYTLDVKHLHLKRQNHQRQDYDLSFYTSMVGIDLHYRRTGDDYKIRSMNLGDDIDTQNIKGTDFGGLTSIVKGFNLYYVFNHKKFSFPAAYSQTNTQRRSAGTAIAGISYSRHTLNIDWAALDNLISNKLPEANKTILRDSTIAGGKVRYTDFSFSGGYAYNWVFARNCLLSAVLSAALAYNRTKGTASGDRFSLRNFSFKNMNIDGVARFAFVWNNTRWFFGASAIMHTYNYRQSRYSTTNLFGTLNFYVGFNFGRKR